MQIAKTLDELRNARQQFNEPIGFVPTMGFLHPGHLSLVKRVRLECSSVVVSIFINPAQFGPQEDLVDYPRDMGKDLALLKACGVDLVWAPKPETMYPGGYQTWVEVDRVSKPLEGARRPRHFRGVATVVAKLFNAVQPQKAYFGQKDAQQAVVIRQMVKDLNFPIDIVVCPLIREIDGLAMSSRNVYLNSNQRQAASVLYRALKKGQSSYESGERNAKKLREVIIKEIDAEPLTHRDYVSVAHPDTLVELDIIDQDALMSMAVYIGKTCLIDNFLLRNGNWHTGQLTGEPEG
ncbi:pantoate--beta-alanine ligase [uncultured Desulfosarcina sp.]|uniref:pantoate--beta-alanine ligase n=1 Tax=uncultured Desulfosarcina sp. TaxID=218289 RepID=UPI0029C96548|nr:pantoate--beta-alanine ligase [uncultured Desulfosarcina sp.]